MSGLRTVLCLAVLGLVMAPACKSTDPAPVIPAEDMKPTGKFDRNNILDLATLTDIESTSTQAIRSFLAHTPYSTNASFLDTYQSNGVRAADAIIAAARNYRINPLVFLAYAEMTQGLVASKDYPFPPERVEYVFGCGCIAKDDCLPTLAGFDRQVDCLGQQLRASIDAIKDNDSQRTPSGWGPNVPRTTLDNLKVTPENEATAAIYDRTPRVNQGARDGTWLLWSVLSYYIAKTNYSPKGSADGRWIGEPCALDTSCANEGAICATNYPDGLCTVKCNGPCPTGDGKPAAYCAAFRDGGFCFQVCNPSSPACRSGYECLNVEGVSESTDTQHVCTPKSVSN